MPQLLRALIWDMGGVLLRTEDQASRAQLANQYGLSNAQLNYLVFGNPAAQLCESGRMQPVERWNFVARKLNLSDKELQAFQTLFWAGDRLDEELIRLIDSLRPRFKTGLLSNAGPDASATLAAIYPRLLTPFDTIVFSGEVGLVKPDPAIYHLILNRMGVSPSQALFIDDFKQNIFTAQMVGLQTIWFRSADQARRDLSSIIDEFSE